ncbi:very large low complexity protein [Babesia caballi]|uniref:Very large low complexity protein n=1 Tax=Babesia caballi TaxID=5871 RepID=A0AAV4LM97_BABCB|nr:very large low complexity protein [Babesia caballi]
MDVNNGVLFRISKEVDDAFPAFVKTVQSRETDEILEFIDSCWQKGDLLKYIFHADRFLHHTLEEKDLWDEANPDSVTTLARRLWLLCIHDASNGGFLRFRARYTPDVWEDMDYIAKSGAPITLRHRIRALLVLSVIIYALRRNLPAVWQVNSREAHAYLDKRLDFVKVEVLTELFKDYLLQAPIGTSLSRRRAWITRLVQLAALMRHIWVFREDVGLYLFEQVLGKVSEVNLRSSEMFYHVRLILLMCPNAALYKLLVDGELFKLWGLANTGSVTSWYTTMLCLLLRAVKFGWATGQPYLVKDITENLPYLFQLLYTGFYIQNTVCAPKYKEMMSSEIMVLLEKQNCICKTFGKFLVYLLCPINESGTAYSTFASELMEHLTALVSAIYPYTHPSYGGKCVPRIANFIRHFVLGYARRVCRERASPALVSCHTGTVDGGKSMRLTRANDMATVDLFYVLALQGMHSRDVHVAHSFEDVIRRLCYLVPEKTLEGLLDQLLQSSDSLTEPHRTLSAMRLLTQMVPLILTYTPQALLPMLDIAIKGVDSSDSFKTSQTLFLLNVVFSYVACRDLSDIQISDPDKLEIVRSLYLAGSEGSSSEVDASLQHLGLNGNFVDVKGALLRVSDEVSIPEDSEGIFSREMVVLQTTKDPKEALAALDALLNQRRYITQQFPSWCQDWFVTMLKFAENRSNPNSNVDSLLNAMDMGVYIMVRSALIMVLSQTDTYTMRCLCETFESWVHHNAFNPDALKYMLAIATSLSFANGPLAMELVFDKVFAKFKRDVENSSKSISETQLVWYTACFSGLVRRANVDLVPRLPSLRFILKVGLGHKAKNAFKYAAKLLQRCVDSLVGVYFVDMKCSANFRDGLSRGLLLWDLPWFVRDAQFRNGRCDISESLAVKWHIATKPELDCAVELCRYAVKLIADLTKDIAAIPEPASLEATEPLDVQIDPSCTIYARVNRACILAKYLLRGLKHFAVDDRDLHVKGLPTVTPVACPEFTTLQQFVVDFVVALLEKYNSIESVEDLVVTNIFAKLLKVVDEYLCRRVNKRSIDSLLESDSLVDALKRDSYLGTALTATRGLMSWTSFYHGVHAASYWQECPRATWLTMLHECYYKRVNMRKFDHECAGHRRALLNMVLQCATCQYKVVSNRAQRLVKSVVRVHKFLKPDVADMLLERGIEVYPQSTDGCSRALESLSCIPETLYSSLLKQIVAIEPLLAKFCKFLLGVVLTAPNKDSLLSKYDSMLLTVLNSREHSPSTAAAGQAVSYVLDTLYDENLKQLQAANHWRFQLYATSLLVCFSPMISPDNTGRYVAWLMEASDHTTKQAHVVTVALFGLYLLLNDSVASANPPAELCEPAFASTLLNSICVVNHDDIKETNSSTVKHSNSIVASVTKLQRAWPLSRTGPNSKAFATQNFLVTYHYFRRVLEAGRVDTIERAISVLDELASSPPTVFENHCAFAEITGALLKASLEASASDRETIWTLLHPVFKREIDALEPKRIGDFMDALRMSLDGCDFSHEACVPIFNLAINYGAPLSTTSLVACDLANAQNTSLGVLKQLKLCRALLQQVTTQHPPILQTLCDGILNEAAIFNDSLQVAEEVGSLCSYLVSLCCMYQDADAFKQRVHSFVAQLVSQVDEKGSPEGADELSTQGLLSVVGLLYSRCMPAHDLTHAHTPLFLAFCLKFSGSTNLTISDAATRAVQHIATAPYYHRGNLAVVEDIVRTLEAASRSASNSTKAKSIGAATRMQRNLCMYVRSTGIVDELIRLYIASLHDRQLRDAARDALTSIAISAGDQILLTLTERFHALVKDDLGDAANAGALGLAALVATAPYHVPAWLPHTLTALDRRFRGFDENTRAKKAHIHAFGVPRRLFVRFRRLNLTVHRIVYSICTAPGGRNEEQLYLRVSQLFLDFVSHNIFIGHVDPQSLLSGDAPVYTVSADSLIDIWLRYRTYVTAVSHLFSYLERFYVPDNSKPTLRAVAFQHFQNVIFEPHREPLRRRMLELLDERRASERTDEFALGAVSQIFHHLSGLRGRQYVKELEVEVVKHASRYYATLAPLWVGECSLVDYLSIVEHCLEQEGQDCDRWLPESTRRPLLDVIMERLIVDQRFSIIGNMPEVEGLIEDEQTEVRGTLPTQTITQDLKMVYRFLKPIEGCLHQIAESVKRCIHRPDEPFKSIEEVLSCWNRYQGNGIISRCHSRPGLLKCCFSDKVTPDEHSNPVIPLSAEIPPPMADGVMVNPTIFGAVHHAFKRRVLDYHDFSKDLVDRWDAVLLTASEHIDAQLQDCSILFSMISSREVFYQCYKFKLAARLLYDRTSLHLEKKALLMIEARCNPDEVLCLRRMIKEVSVYRGSTAYSEVHLLSKASWPCLRDYAEKIKLHPEFESTIAQFDEQQRAYPHRRVEYNRMLGRVVLELPTSEGPRTLTCDIVQASALLLFVGPSLTLAELASGLGVSKPFARMVITPLLEAGVLRISVRFRLALTARSQEDDNVVISGSFKDGTDVTIDVVPRYRNVQPAAAGGSKVDPSVAIDAAVVSLLKSMKSMTLEELLAQLPRFSREVVQDGVLVPLGLGERLVQTYHDPVIRHTHQIRLPPLVESGDALIPERVGDVVQGAAVLRPAVHPRPARLQLEVEFSVPRGVQNYRREETAERPVRELRRSVALELNDLALRYLVETEAEQKPTRRRYEHGTPTAAVEAHEAVLHAQPEHGSESPPTVPGDAMAVDVHGLQPGPERSHRLYQQRAGGPRGRVRERGDCGISLQGVDRDALVCVGSVAGRSTIAGHPNAPRKSRRDDYEF